jgi:hypothetical protein
VREVELPPDLDVLLLLGREDLVQQPVGVLGRQLRVLRHAVHLPVDSHRGLGTGCHVQIGRAVRDHLLEQLINGEGSLGRHSSGESSAAGGISLRRSLSGRNRSKERVVGRVLPPRRGSLIRG